MQRTQFGKSASADSHSKRETMVALNYSFCWEMSLLETDPPSIYPPLQITVENRLDILRLSEERRKHWRSRWASGARSPQTPSRDCQVSHLQTLHSRVLHSWDKRMLWCILKLPTPSSWSFSLMEGISECPSHFSQVSQSLLWIDILCYLTGTGMEKERYLYFKNDHGVWVGKGNITDCLRNSPNFLHCSGSWNSNHTTLDRLISWQIFNEQAW